MAQVTMDRDEEAPEEVPLEAPGVRVSRATGCYRDLTWDLELEPPVSDWGGLCRALERSGWRDGSRLAGLQDFAAADGSHLVVVAACGWLQLRLHYPLPQAERRGLALKLAEHVAALARGEARGEALPVVGGEPLT
jgi:hypothetical protein